MPTIVLYTEIIAPIEICFDLSRSIDLHQISTDHTKERAIAGVKKGLIGLNEQVTWEAVHYGIKQRLTSKIVAYERPFYFVDEQVKGPFKSIYHEHRFEVIGSKTLMTDRFSFESPFGILGRIANLITVKNHLNKLLTKRNQVIKFYAESGKWQSLLSENTSSK